MDQTLRSLPDDAKITVAALRQIVALIEILPIAGRSCATDSNKWVGWFKYLHAKRVFDSQNPVIRVSR